MIKLNANTTKYGSVQVYDKDLEVFAYKQLKDYQKGYFEEPKALNIEDFVEFYLEKKVYYYQISTEDSSKRVLGSTAITDGKLAVICEDNKPSYIIFNRGDICIDEKACECESRVRFTLAHEAWHSQFDTNLNKELLDGEKTIKDTSSIIDSPTMPAKSKNQWDWIEYHANRYAVYLLMPKRFVNKLFKRYHKELFGKKKRLSLKNPKKTWLIIIKISESLSVSKEALAYRLLELNLISIDIFKSLDIKKGKRRANYE